MNKKILIFTLVLFTIISIGSVAAASADDSVTSPQASISVTDVDDSVSDTNNLNEGSNPETTTIDINNTMSNDEIQSAFNTIKNNTVVNFQQGEYKDINLMVTNQSENTRLCNITFNGNGATLTGTLKVTNESNYYDGLFEIQNTDGFTITGFNFILNGVTAANMKTPSCVVIYNTTNGIFENNNVSGGRFGVYVGSKFNGPNNNTIVRNNIVTNVSDMGIISFGSAYTTIANNTVINPVNHGIDVRHATGPYSLVQNNTVIGAREGIYVMHSPNHKVLNNNIYASDIGITCYGSSNVLCDNNSFLNNTKVGFLLSSGYSNITIGEGNNYSGLVFVPMPPTFSYKILKGDSTYVSLTNGTFSESDANKNTTYVEVFLIGDEEGNPLRIDSGLTTILNDTVISLNTNITVKIWKYDDNNHIGENETITVTIDGVDYSGKSDVTGAVYVDINVLKEGKHYMYVKYPGSDVLKPSEWSGVLQVGSGEPKATSIVAKNMVTTAVVQSSEGKTGSYFNITLKDVDGKALAYKKVQITLNYKIYTVTTDDKGVAKLQINLPYKGVYATTICFDGDNDYKSSIAVCKITVNPKATSLTVPSKVYKASAKTKVLTATLKDNKGKLVANKKVTFTVNGKNYVATTNSKGVATVKVALKAKKTYYFTAKFAGDNTYKAVAKKAKVVIK